MNDLLANNQRAFAARFAAPPVPPVIPKQPNITTDSAAMASTLMPPPAAVLPGASFLSSAPGSTGMVQLQLEENPQLQAQIEAACAELQRQQSGTTTTAAAGAAPRAAPQPMQTQQQQPQPQQAQAQARQQAQQAQQQQQQQHQQAQAALVAQKQAAARQQQQQHTAAAAAAAAVVAAVTDASSSGSSSSAMDITATPAAAVTGAPVNLSALPPAPQISLKLEQTATTAPAGAAGRAAAAASAPAVATPSTAAAAAIAAGANGAAGTAAPLGAAASGAPATAAPIPQGYTGHMGGIGTSGQLGATAASTSTSSSSKRRSSSKKAVARGGGGRWTKEEDQKLRAAVAAVGPQNWKMIATDYLGDQRSDVQCLHRWQKVLQPGLVKGPWTKEEDQIIIDCIEAGITKWSEIAERIPGRIGKQCRERWFNHLDPSLKKGGWTDEEDAILVEAQGKWGNSWTKIAKLLPGRSENAVKNRWNSATRRRQKAQQKTSDKLVLEAQAKVNAADAADKAAEAERGHSGGRGLADDEDTECVPKSAIALLRAKREQARLEAKRCSDLGLPPPEEAVRLGVVPASGGQPHQVPTMETAGMVGLAAMGQLGNIPTPMNIPIGGLLSKTGGGSATSNTSSSSSSSSSSNSSSSTGKGGNSASSSSSSSSSSNSGGNSGGNSSDAGDAMDQGGRNSSNSNMDGMDEDGNYDDEVGASDDDDDVDDIVGDDGLDGLVDEASKLSGHVQMDPKQRGVGDSLSGGVRSGGATSDNGVEAMLFGDSSLTEREKELIRRAYFAGIAQSGGPSPPHGTGRDAITASSLKLKLKRDRNTGSHTVAEEQGSPVQWDFQSDPQPQGCVIYILDISFFDVFLASRILSVCSPFQEYDGLEHSVRLLARAGHRVRLRGRRLLERAHHLLAARLDERAPRRARGPGAVEFLAHHVPGQRHSDGRDGAICGREVAPGAAHGGGRHGGARAAVGAPEGLLGAPEHGQRGEEEGPQQLQPVAPRRRQRRGALAGGAAGERGGDAARVRHRVRRRARLEGRRGGRRGAARYIREHGQQQQRRRPPQRQRGHLRRHLQPGPKWHLLLFLLLRKHPLPELVERAEPRGAAAQQRLVADREHVASARRRLPRRAHQRRAKIGAEAQPHAGEPDGGELLVGPRQR